MAGVTYRDSTASPPSSDSVFDAWSRNPDLDLYPPHLRTQIDGINDWTYRQFNNGVYRTGFAKTQEAYEAGFEDVFAALDKMEAIRNSTS